MIGRCILASILEKKLCPFHSENVPRFICIDKNIVIYLYFRFISFKCYSFIFITAQNVSVCFVPSFTYLVCQLFYCSFPFGIRFLCSNVNGDIWDEIYNTMQVRNNSSKLIIRIMSNSKCSQFRKIEGQNRAYCIVT